MNPLEELRTQRAAIETEMRGIHDAAGDEQFTEEQGEQFDALDERRAELDKQIEKREKREAAIRSIGSQSRSTEPADGGRGAPSFHRNGDLFDGDVRTLSGPEVRTRSLKVVDSDDGTRHLRDDQKEHLHKVLRTVSGDSDGELVGRLLLATENPAYRSAFQKVAASTAPVFTTEEGRAIEQVGLIKRAMSVGSPGGGGYAVPVLIDPTIIMTAQGSTNDILRLARVETITNDTWRGLSTAGVSWKFDAEAATSTDNSPTMAQPEVVTRRADGFIPFSIEIGMDWPGFAEAMSMLLAEGYDELLADKLTVGTNGSNEPDGLISSLAAISGVKREVAVAGTLAAADVYALWNQLPQRFRRAQNCAWMSSTDVQNSIRQLGTVDPNFTVNITQEAIPRLFGREYPMNDFMQDDPGGTGTQPLLVVGDFRGYVVAQRAGMQVEFLPMLFDVTNSRPTGQRGWFAWARVGGGVVNSNGFRLLTNRSA
jgi:HK97 family phage major capsid protein